tara:strand:- start:63 stop:677 length:615 start_codon:yes stop_codon:yes gene_type:complete
MALPILVILAGQVFRLAGTQAVKNLIKKSGARIVKEVPKKGGKAKPVKGSEAFEKLIKEKKPDLFEKVGNVFAKKSNKMNMSSPGRASSEEGIVSGIIRVGGRDRGQQVRGGVKVLGGAAVTGAGALAIDKGIKAVKAMSSKKKGSTLSKSSDISRRIPTTYTVKKGDTFSSIAKEKGTTVSKLKELNTVDPRKLQIGSRVRLR